VTARYAITRSVRAPYDETVGAVRSALAEQGFGVLTEVDIAATLRTKLDVEVPKQVILGACRPPLAYQALQAEPSVGLLLPCNVVVRQIDDETTLVEAVDPQTMVAMTENDDLKPVADEASQRLTAALSSLS
jgi:uncharacterized protein (DUF302 family)